MKSDLRQAEFKLDKDGREFHHSDRWREMKLYIQNIFFWELESTYLLPKCIFFPFRRFVRMYQAEIKNLDRILETLARTGAVPTGVQFPSTV